MRSASTSGGRIPRPARKDHGYTDYVAADVTDLACRWPSVTSTSLEQAATLASMCGAGGATRYRANFGPLSFRSAKKPDDGWRSFRFLNDRLAHLSGQRGMGEPPRSLITLQTTGKEDCDGSL